MERVRLARSNGLLHPERRVAIFGENVGDYDPPDPMEKAARRAAEVYPKLQTLNPLFLWRRQREGQQRYTLNPET